jgi:hypothetical protein
MNTLSILTIYKDIYFIDFWTSQYLNFLKEVFSTLEEFILIHKIYFGNNNTIDVCGKALLSSNYQMGFPR